MGAHRIEIAPDVIAEGKRLYEQTPTAMRDIAAMMGICRRTLENRVREFNWKRRRVAALPIDLAHAARGAAMAVLTGDAPEVDAMAVTPQRRAVATQRMQAIVEREMEAVERVLAVISPADQVQAEGSARTLATIARALRDIAALNLAADEVKDAHDAQHADDAAADDAIPRDLDAFREELARRLQGIIDAHRANAEGGAQGVSPEPVERRGGVLPD